MSVAQIESDLLKLPLRERAEFARWFYENEHEFVGGNRDSDELSPEWKAEILRRDQEMDADPSLEVPVTKEWFDQVRKKLADARASEKSTR